MRILVACEESQTVTKAFRRKGFEAWSCDILPCSGGHPEWHIQTDVREVLDDDWNLMIAHPPCDHLAVSGARWFKEKQADGRQQRAIDFFLSFTTTPIKHFCIENPVSIMSTLYRKPDQYIQPWQFGHDASKKTGLWLQNLPLLIPTDIVVKKLYANQTPSGQNKLGPSPDRARLRSQTYDGIAEAMADQWGNFLLKTPI